MAGCQLQAARDAPAIARVTICRRIDGVSRYITVVPAAYVAEGGVPACTDHAHNIIDGMLMAGLGPTTPPAREQIPQAEQ
jgi:hypothetical protein